MSLAILRRPSETVWPKLSAVCETDWSHNQTITFYILTAVAADDEAKTGLALTGQNLP